MNNEVETYCKKWLQKANEDAASVSKLSSNEDDLLFFKSTIGFHCQQSIEKYLKAFLSFQRIHFSAHTRS